MDKQFISFCVENFNKEFICKKEKKHHFKIDEKVKLLGFISSIDEMSVLIEMKENEPEYINHVEFFTYFNAHHKK